MNLMTTQQERRKFTRYSTKEGSYASISPDSTKLGQIVDISMGGLSFKYIDKKPITSNDKNLQETLFLSSMGYYVGDIDFQTVSDYEVPDNLIPDSSFDTMKIRVRHVKFTDLKLKQLFDLDYYIENNTTLTKNFTNL